MITIVDLGVTGLDEGYVFCMRDVEYDRKLVNHVIKLKVPKKAQELLLHTLEQTASHSLTHKR